MLRSNRSIAYQMDGQLEAAIEAGYDAVEFAEHASRVEHDAPPTMMPLCLFTLGNALLAADRIEEATASYEACLSIAEATGEPPGPRGTGSGVPDLARQALARLRARDSR